MIMITSWRPRPASLSHVESSESRLVFAAGGRSGPVTINRLLLGQFRATTLFNKHNSWDEVQFIVARTRPIELSLISLPQLLFFFRKKMLSRQITVLLCLLVHGISSSVPLIPLKQQFVIGGWIPGSSDLFMKKWTPVLQNYLTESIGSLYTPPISFKLIPVDYSSDSSSQYLIKSGQVDFICK